LSAPRSSNLQKLAEVKLKFNLYCWSKTCCAESLG